MTPFSEDLNMKGNIPGAGCRWGCYEEGQIHLLQAVVRQHMVTHLCEGAKTLLDLLGHSCWQSPKERQIPR
jgi:hypothetical protein